MKNKDVKFYSPRLHRNSILKTPHSIIFILFLSPSLAAASFTGFNQDEFTRRDKMRKITFFDQFLIIEAWAGEHC